MKGLTYFEFNIETGEVKEAEWKPLSVFHSYSPTEETTLEMFELVRIEGCKYIQALNLKNAKRKFAAST